MKTNRDRLIDILSVPIHPRIDVAYTEVVADFLLDNDVFPIVRCKDCKHRGTDDCPMHYKGAHANEDFLKKVDNDFCSYGERKHLGWYARVEN